MRLAVISPEQVALSAFSFVVASVGTAIDLFPADVVLKLLPY